MNAVRRWQSLILTGLGLLLVAAGAVGIRCLIWLERFPNFASNDVVNLVKSGVCSCCC